MRSLSHSARRTIGGPSPPGSLERTRTSARPHEPSVGMHAAFRPNSVTPYTDRRIAPRGGCLGVAFSLLFSCRPERPAARNRRFLVVAMIRAVLTGAKLHTEKTRSPRWLGERVARPDRPAMGRTPRPGRRTDR